MVARRISLKMVVKAYLLAEDEAVKEIHKFPFVCEEEWDAPTTVYELRQTISMRFFDEEDTAFEMFYRDGEGNLVAISSYEDLMMGVACMKDDLFLVDIKVCL
ncbi:sequestosome-1-like isoform X3 [Entelurus aequoreus]|uniref:sequestosome-1-like isoform X3 n=1 Tax=Entelurus aequoreus TaxID=161455 RepID=UPI002B1DBADB|nr:sequestosome-1-like isoform X3 [Entelurus aequoreus]